MASWTSGFALNSPVECRRGVRHRSFRMNPECLHEIDGQVWYSYLINRIMMVP